jgi:multiple sugar transport system substrate-binding protein
MATKLSRRSFLQWSATVGVASALAACTQVVSPGATTQQAGGASAGEAAATVTWWNPDAASWQPSYQKMAAEVMKQNPKIKVDIQNVPEDGFLEKISAMIAGNTGPDVWTWFYATDTARHGFLEEVTPFLERDGIKPEATWFPICIKRATYQNKMYSVPRDGVWSLIGYNKALFQEMGAPLPVEGWTLDDYLTACKTLTSTEKSTWGTLISGNGALSWDTAFCWNMGFEIVSEDGRKVKGLLDSPTSIEAIQWMLDLQDKHKVAPSGAQSQALGDFPFGSGKAGMFAAAGWSLADLNSVKFEWGLVSAPVKQKGDEVHAWGDSVQHYMWHGSKQKEAAWALMKFISSAEGNRIPAAGGAWTPPTPATWKAMKWDSDPVMGKFWAQSQKPTAVPNYLRTEYENDCVMPNFEGIWTHYLENGERPLDKIVVDAATAAQACLDKSYAA